MDAGFFCSTVTEINTLQLSLSIFCNLELILAEALVKDKEAGSFVVRDSTSYKGSFGLAMKMDQSSTNHAANAHPGKLLLVKAAGHNDSFYIILKGHSNI